MKQSIVLFFLALVFIPATAQYTLQKLWETDSILQAPESVCYNSNTKMFYITNIGDFSKEGKGFLSRMDHNGKIIDPKWTVGLTAPKGMGLAGDRLYVAEHTTVAVIDATAGSVIKRISVEGAVMLNDVTIDGSGAVFVSDTRTNKVHRIKNDKPEVYLENVSSANGLLADGDHLYILAGDKLLKADKNKNLTTIADGIEGGADGIERVNDREFIVTGWEGTVYIINENGSKQLLLDTRKEKANAADLWYDAATQTVYIPVMSKNKVAAYKLVE